MYYANPDKILMPWTPVVASEQNGACKISVWGRTYSVADGFNCAIFYAELPKKNGERSHE